MLLQLTYPGEDGEEGKRDSGSQIVAGCNGSGGLLSFGPCAS